MEEVVKVDAQGLGGDVKDFGVSFESNAKLLGVLTLDLYLKR